MSNLEGGLLISETKANAAKLTKQQERFFKGGESVSFVGDKANKMGLKGKIFDSSKVETNIVQVQVKVE